MQGLDRQGGAVADTFVHADDNFFLTFYGLLVAIGGFLDFLLRKALFNGLDHTSHGVNFVEVFPSSFLHLIGQVFHKVGTSQRISCVRNTTFVGKNLLSSQSDSCRLLRG